MKRTYAQIMEDARRVVPEVSVDHVRARLSNGSAPVLVDVREREEFREGHLTGALSVPRGYLEMRIE